MIKAVIPGSYDPITVGHIDLIERASKLCDELIVLVCSNSSKCSFVGVEDRISLAKSATSHLNNVKVVSYDGLFAEYCNDNGISLIIKGIRNAIDFSYESELKAYNDKIFADNFRNIPETIFLPANPSLSYCSSTFVREMIKHNVAIDNYVPDSKTLLQIINKQ